MHYAPLKCHNCGSTDVTITPPWYHCNYCGATHPLPPEHAQYETLKRSFKKRYIFIISLLALLAIVMGMLYIKDSFKTTPPLPQTKSTSTPPQSLATFPNMVFDLKTLGDINLFKRTPEGNYLLAGLDRFHTMQLYLLSSNAKVLWHHILGTGYYIDAIITKENDVIVTHYQNDTGHTIRIHKEGKTVFKKPAFFHKLISSDNGFIGIKEGTITALDGNGNILWKKVIDAKKVTRRAGAKRDPIGGKMIPFSKAFNRLHLQYLLQLHDGSYVALGKYDSNVAIVRFDSKGKILQDARYNLGRTYIKAVIVTDDGGFAMVAGSGLHFYKFDAQGNVAFKRDLHNYQNTIFTYDMIKTDKGYLISSSIGKDSQMQLLQIDREGHQLNVHRYAKKGMRLHPRFLVKSPSNDYLLAVTTEVFEPWIIHIKPNGSIEANLDDPTQYSHVTLPKGEIKPIQPYGNRLPSHTPIQLHTSAPLKKVMVKTTSFLGGAVRKMIPSHNGKRVYAITGATGFKIFQKKASGQWRETGNILRTHSKLIIKAHYIGSENGKPPKHGTPFDYDNPSDLWITKDETKAYIADTVHGFYCVDITNAAHPHLLYAAPKLKLHSFVLSSDESEILFYAQGRLQKMTLEKIRNTKENINITDGDGQQKIVALDNRQKAVVSDRNFLMLYNSNTGQLIGQQNVGTGAYISKLKSDGKRMIAFQKGYGIVEIFQLSKSAIFEQVSTIQTKKIINDILLLSKQKLLCSADKEGVVCSSFKDPLNPIPYIHYRDKALNGANTLITDILKQTLMIAFYHEGLGAAPLSP